MGPYFRRRSRPGALALVAVAGLSAAFLAATAGRVSAAGGGHPPCASCPDRMPPAGGAPSGGQGSGQGGPTAAPTPAAASQAVQPLISLGSVSVANGVAAVTGVVNTGVSIGSSALAKLHVTVNTSPIDLSASGHFSARVDLGTQGAIVVKASGQGEVSTITIPTSSVPADGSPADALAQLDADVIVLLQPPGGFTSVDGLSVDAGVHVKAIAGISGLDLNGVNVLAKLRIGSSSSKSSSSSGSSGSTQNPPSSPSPGSSQPPAPASPPCKHSASTSVSGSAKTVALTVTSTNGASETTSVLVRQIRSVIRVGRMLSISAFGARGIRITAVRFDTSHVGAHRLGVTVTVRDRRNYLVRDAVVMLVPTAHRPSLRGSLAQMSTTLGTARFTVPVTTPVAGHRLYLTVVARTPRASTRVTRSVALCGCAG